MLSKLNSKLSMHSLAVSLKSKATNIPGIPKRTYQDETDMIALTPTSLVAMQYHWKPHSYQHNLSSNCRPCIKLYSYIKPLAKSGESNPR